MIASAKLERLLRLIWNSPVFGDSFPSDASRPLTVLGQMQAIHPSFVATLTPVLAQGLPLLSVVEVDKLVEQIASVSILCCTAIAAGEIVDTEQLRAAATVISLIHWADQGIDAGDEVMLATVRSLNGGLKTKLPTPSDMSVSSPTVQARLTALRWIEREVERFSRPEDQATLLECGLQETLQNDCRKRELSRLYGSQLAENFWAAYATEMVEALLATAATIHVTAVIYVAYRQSQPELPSLPEIFQDRAVMEVLRGPYNAAIRIFDDLSDRLKDSNHYSGRGEFNLNIFNQPESGFLRVFLNRADLKDERVIGSVLEAFHAGTEDSRAYIMQVFMELVRERLASLPAPLWNHYAVFLRLAKRVMETAYVNFMNDLESPISA